MNRFMRAGAWSRTSLIEYCHSVGSWDVHESMSICSLMNDSSSADCRPCGVPMSRSAVSATQRELTLTSSTQQYAQGGKFGEEPETRESRFVPPRDDPLALPDAIRIAARQWSIAVGQVDSEAPAKAQSLPGE
jgi:hypothetical protein